MPTRLLILLVTVGAVWSAAREGAAQDPGAVACQQAVDGQDWDQVISACPAVLADLPENHPYFVSWTQSLNYAYGIACPAAHDAQQWDRAIAACEPAVQANPDAFIVNYYLGRAYSSTQDWARAAINFSSFLDGAQNSDAASQLSQQIAVAQKYGGLAYARANAAQDAIPLLQAAAGADATDVEVHYRLGIALLQTNDPAGAERALSVVLAQDPIPGVLYLAGQLNYNAGEFTKAVERLSGYLAADPAGERAPDAHFMLGQALQGSDEDRAITHYRGFLEGAGSGGADPREADANYAVGSIYYNRDDCANAEQFYKRLMEIAPDHANAAQVQEILASIAEGACGDGDR